MLLREGTPRRMILITPFHPARLPGQSPSTLWRPTEIVDELNEVLAA
jgi:hypothetical protein